MHIGQQAGKQDLRTAIKEASYSATAQVMNTVTPKVWLNGTISGQDKGKIITCYHGQPPRTGEAIETGGYGGMTLRRWFVTGVRWAMQNDEDCPEVIVELVPLLDFADAAASQGYNLPNFGDWLEIERARRANGEI
jgi:hypothetical protein